MFKFNDIDTRNTSVDTQDTIQITKKKKKVYNYEKLEKQGLGFISMSLAQINCPVSRIRGFSKMNTK